MSQRIGLYGGSFDPIHHGHLIVARAVAERTRLSTVCFLPSGRPPHKLDRAIVGVEHRLAMVQAAISGEALFSCSDFDARREGPSYTIDTVRHFRSLHGPAAELFWIIGADSLAELVTWRQVSDLVDECTIIAAARPGWDQVDWSSFAKLLTTAQIDKLRGGVVSTPQIDISSTEIRDRLMRRLSIRYLVPEAVQEFIDARGLYQSRTI